MFSRITTKKFTSSFSPKIDELKETLDQADALFIGAGAGLSTSAGFVYSGSRFQKYFSDFAAKYHFSDMYAGGFYPYETPEELWGFWSRYIYINRYMKAPIPVYDALYDLVKEKDYFVLTTNVDHCFQRAGFDKRRLFYMQGDFGLFQCSLPCQQTTYDNETVIRKMVEAQGFVIGEDGTLILPEDVTPSRKVPTELVPHCPHCGRPMTMNLRSDDTFVQDDGWYAAQSRYEDFLRRHTTGKVLYLELGVGMNTPVWIKYPFWQRTVVNPEATYACINYDEAYAPAEILNRSICIDSDIWKVIEPKKQVILQE